MTHEELLEIGTLISVEHKNFRLIESGKPNARFRLWMATFGRVPGSALRKAVQVCLQRSPYEPKISEITSILKEANNAAGLTASEAFQKAQQIVSRFGLYRPKEAGEFASKHYPQVWKTIEGLGFREFCLSENPEALRAHFYKTYEAQLAADSRRRELKSLSAEVRGLVKSLGNTLSLEEKSRGENDDDNRAKGASEEGRGAIASRESSVAVVRVGSADNSSGTRERSRGGNEAGANNRTSEV